MAPAKVSDKLAAEIAVLGNLSRAELVARWEASFKTPPPKGIRQPLMIRALAYRLQAKRWGGLRGETARRLQVIAVDRDPQGGGPASKAVADIKPGLRLYREWNGRTHVVEVEDDGVHWNGMRYRSLSAVARAITGARWSGPRFFGLKGAHPS